MPLPAARHAGSNLGRPRDQRPGRAPRSDSQVDRLLRRGAPGQRQVRLDDVLGVQRSNLPGVPAPPRPPSPPRPTHGHRAGQRRLPPRSDASAVAASNAPHPPPRVPAPVQPAAGADRARLEARASTGDPQPVLRHPRSAGCRHRVSLPAMAQSESGASSSMLQHLRRCVYLHLCQPPLRVDATL